MYLCARCTCLHKYIQSVVYEEYCRYITVTHTNPGTLCTRTPSNRLILPAYIQTTTTEGASDRGIIYQTKQDTTPPTTTYIFVLLAISLYSALLLHLLLPRIVSPSSGGGGECSAAAALYTHVSSAVARSFGRSGLTDWLAG